MFLGLQKSLQNNFYDFASASSEIVVVAIDEKSLSENELGPLREWSRVHFARAIEILNEQGASVIGIDLTFSDQKEGDSAFGEALSNHPNVVLGARYFFKNNRLTKELPTKTLLAATPRIGWINVGLDEDGFVRKIPIFEPNGGKSTEAFSLQVARWYLGVPPVGFDIQNHFFQFGPATRIPVMTYRDRRNNLDFNFMFVNYFAKPGGYQRISFADLLKERFFDDEGALIDFNNKIALIGTTAMDLKDYYLSPVSNGEKMPGVEIHANAIQTLMEGKFLRDQSDLSLLLTLAGLLILNLFLFSFLRLRFAIPLVLLELFGIVVAGISAYEYRIFLNVIYPIFTVSLSFVGTYLLRFILEQKERKFVEGAFGHYVNKDVVDQILKHPEMMHLGGAKREVTAFFSDIAGFTSISEKMEPGKLVQFLNGYLDEMTRIILGHHGTLDKYEGDAIMAFWGAPVPSADHAKNACLTALENQKKLAQIRSEWETQGLPALHVRIGINTGDVIVGNMGSKNRFDYTIMGDHVNLASRLESINKQYGTEIMISEYTYMQIHDDFVCRELDLIRVKGKEKPVRVYELVGAKNEVAHDVLKQIESFEEALKLYRQKSFESAAEKFKALTDDPPSAVFAERCEAFIKNPPAEDWDGVYTFVVK